MSESHTRSRSAVTEGRVHASRREGDGGPVRVTVAAAESCTGGLVASRLVSIPGSGEWFVGGVVAYDVGAKVGLLGVTPGPVITAEAVRQMATGVRVLLGTSIGVATTGVGGPESEEDRPVGTVFIGLDDGVHRLAVEHRLAGNPDRVRQEAADLAVRAVMEARQRLLIG
jgi:PncC family amidohydrolase